MSLMLLFFVYNYFYIITSVYNMIAPTMAPQSRCGNEARRLCNGGSNNN